MVIAFILMYFLGSTAISFASNGRTEFSEQPADLLTAETEPTAISDEEIQNAPSDEPMESGEVHDVYFYALPGELEQLSEAEDAEAADDTADDGDGEYSRLLESREWETVTSDTFAGLSNAEKVELIGQMAHDDAMSSGVPASLTAAQAILESGWMESNLTREYENYFGIKASSGGFNWEGSTWEPGNGALLSTQEEYEPGEITTIEDTFRVYNGAWDSIKDHSAYLANMPVSTGGKLYEGMTDPSKTIEEKLQILMDGGYATGSDYADELLAVIDSYDLKRFDV